MLRKNSLLIWIVMIVLVLSACSSNNNNKASNAPPEKEPEKVVEPAATPEPEVKEDVELRMAWWGSQVRHDRTLQAIELFEQKNPNIKIIAEYSGFDGYFDKLSTQIAAGNAPDLIQMGGNIKEYVDRNALLALDPYVGTTLHVDKFSDSVVKEATFDNKYYGVTIGVSGFGLLVNTSMFEKAGVPLPSVDWSYEDLKSISNQISEKLGKGFYGSYDLSGNKSSLGDYLASEGMNIYTNGELGFTKEHMIEWFNMWSELRKSGGIVPAEVQVANDPTAADKSLVAKGQVAMQYASASQIFGYQSLTEDKLGLFTSPKRSKGTGMIPPVSGQFMTVYAKSAHPEEAAMYIDFMVNDPDAAAILGNDRGVPPSSDMRDALAQTSTPVDKVLYDFISLSTEVASNFDYEIVPFDNEFTKLLQLTSEQIGFGQLSIEAAVDQFMTEADKIIKKK
ncbi:MAG: extracellular solute-binding protein [Paenibacillaceae bacterium]